MIARNLAMCSALPKNKFQCVNDHIANPFVVLFSPNAVNTNDTIKIATRHAVTTCIPELFFDGSGDGLARANDVSIIQFSFRHSHLIASKQRLLA